MSGHSPHVVILGGPNGAGKSTAAPSLLSGRLEVSEFVNADTIARGLSGFAPEGAAIDAGRIMLRRIRQLVTERRSFAFETTLASRAFGPMLGRWKEEGYLVHVVLLWLPSVDLALERVRERVRMGGHDVPAETIRRRFFRGVRNFHQIYRPLATTWRVLDNSRARPRLIALGNERTPEVVRDLALWSSFLEAAEAAR